MIHPAILLRVVTHTLRSQWHTAAGDALCRWRVFGALQQPRSAALGIWMYRRSCWLLTEQFRAWQSLARSFESHMAIQRRQAEMHALSDQVQMAQELSLIHI